MPPNCYLGADNRGLGVSGGVEGLSAGGSQLAAPCRSDPRCHWKAPGDTVGRQSFTMGVPSWLLEKRPTSDVWGSSYRV